MPYVKQERRPDLDKIVDAIVEAGFEAGDMVSFLSALSGDSYYYFKQKHDTALALAKKCNVQPNGDINYILFKYCKYYVKPSYNNYKNFMGDIYNAADSCRYTSYKNEYRESAEWIRIKLLIPYEEEKILENGDV